MDGEGTGDGECAAGGTASEGASSATGRSVPCVRIAREEGEATRRELAERGLLADGYDIETSEDGAVLYLPVTDADRARVAGYAVVERRPASREAQTLPDDLLGFEPAYERLGEIAIVDVDDPGEARRIAEAIVASDLPVESVVNRASKVKGRERVREWDVLVGETETVHREYGYEFLVDVAAVYFSPRLATERHRVVEQVDAGEHAFDMFAGVGPFVVPMAGRGADCVGVDVNERAVEYLRENARRNGVTERVAAIHADVREVTGYDDWADRIVMNLPHSAGDFLDAAVWLAGADCVVHYYDIQPDDDPFAAGERAIRAAAGDAYDVTVEHRREVRSYAPGQVNVCLDVRLTRA